MKNKKFYVLSVFLALVITTALVSAGVQAHRGRGFFNKTIDEQTLTELKAKQQTLQTALDNNDYQAWYDLMMADIQKLENQITQENFDKLVQIRQLVSDGKYEEARVLQEGLDLRPGLLMMSPHHFKGMMAW